MRRLKYRYNRFAHAGKHQTISERTYLRRHLTDSKMVLPLIVGTVVLTPASAIGLTSYLHAYSTEEATQMIPLLTARCTCIMVAAINSFVCLRFHATINKKCAVLFPNFTKFIMLLTFGRQKTQINDSTTVETYAYMTNLKNTWDMAYKTGK